MHSAPAHLAARPPAPCTPPRSTVPPKPRTRIIQQQPCHATRCCSGRMPPCRTFHKPGPTLAVKTSHKQTAAACRRRKAPERHSCRHRRPRQRGGRLRVRPSQHPHRRLRGARRDAQPLPCANTPPQQTPWAAAAHAAPVPAARAPCCPAAARAQQGGGRRSPRPLTQTHARFNSVRTCTCMHAQPPGCRVLPGAAPYPHTHVSLQHTLALAYTGAACACSTK